jgi:excisionase family DNA binding protein
MTANKKWITKAQAAERLGVHRRTVDNYLSGGILTKYKDGTGRVLIDADECAKLRTPVPVVQSANR